MPLWPTGSVQSVVHLANNIFWNSSVAVAVPLQASFQRHIQNPKLDVGIALRFRAVDNLASMSGVCVYVIYDDVGIGIHKCVHALKEDFKNLTLIFLISSVAPQFVPN